MQWLKNTTDIEFKTNQHFLQSSSWAAFQNELGHTYFYREETGWQCLAILEPSRIGSRLYCPYGPTAKTPKALQQALKALRELAAEQHVMFIRVEPTGELTKQHLKKLGLKHSFKDIQQAQTWVLDLTQTQENLLTNMTPTNRNLWRNYSKKDLKIRVSNLPSDMQIFIDMMGEVAQHNKIKQHSNNYYQKMANALLTSKSAKLYIMEHANKPVASAFCFDSPSTRYYAHAASRFEARKLHPGTPLLVQMIIDAQANGQTQFDFCGVAPQNAEPDHPWAGFTKFKKSFGGNYKQYLGTWELPTSPKYHLYRALYKTYKTIK